MKTQTNRINNLAVDQALNKVQEYKRSLQVIRMDLDDLLYKLEHSILQEKSKATR